MSNRIKRILVIAGSDSSGGAGLEADQKVIAAHGCYAMTATTALTAQNTLGVDDIHEIPTSFVQKQIDACASDVGVDVVKTGMLATASTISMVAESLKRHSIPFSVVDPVMVATSGARLLPSSAVQTLVDDLLPETSLLTPNIPEAQLILSAAGRPFGEIQTLNDFKRLGEAVAGLGPRHVLIKGGHCPLDKQGRVAKTQQEKAKVVNVLYTEGDHHVFEDVYQESKNTHGTGCSLASAIACNIACCLSVPASVEKASAYIAAGIRTAQPLGHGCGPINHFHSQRIMPFYPDHFISYLLSRPDVAPVWHAFTHHAFVQQLGDGSLPIHCYKQYMRQDYLYLLQFARANALAAYKAQDLESVGASADIVGHIVRETELHVRECEELGISREEMDGEEEHVACTAYGRFVLDVGVSQDWLALQVAMLPCLLGYHVIATRLMEEQGRYKGREVNRYRQWIDNYVGVDYEAAVRKGRALAEKHAVKQSPERIEELVKVFIHATKMESAFWDMGLEAKE